MPVPAKKTITEHGNTLYRLDDAERQRWIKAVQLVYKIWIDEMNKRGLPGQEMFNDLLATTSKHGRK